MISCVLGNAANKYIGSEAVLSELGKGKELVKRGKS